VIAVVVITGMVVLALAAVALWQAQQLTVAHQEATDAVQSATEASVQVREARALRIRALRALDLLPHGVVICDLDGDVVARNRMAQAFVDARHGDALVEAAITELQELGTHGHAHQRTVSLMGPPPRTLVLDVRPVVDGSIITIVDVSDERRVEALRRDFVANISHELRTPVGALAVLAETLLDETRVLASTEAVTERQGESLAVIGRLAGRMQGEATRLGETIDDLLELSRLQAGEPLTRQRTEAGEVLHAAEARVAGAAEARGITVVVDPSATGITVWADRRQLVSAVANLLDNAVKYSDPGATVDLRARRSAQEVTLEVRDHGIGIPEADQERIFERFYRVDRARRRDTGGTGLGLAIVRHVARNHGGHVTLQSIEGEGSTFGLPLPDVDEEATTPSTGEPVDEPRDADRAVDSP
jgi:two-component system sensor histidine kinase SenX3